MKIAVLMSTYNGEKYLKEQIESILAQRLSPGCGLVLFIRDDGSSDQTCRIIDSYSERYENIICIPSSDPAHIGLRESFLMLLETAVERGEGFDYYAFSDQDDVWLEDKLEKALKKLEVSDNKRGAMCYSNRVIVDEKLRIQEMEHKRYFGDFMEIAEVWPSGNTMVFNDCLAKYATLYHPQTANHDTWVYKVAKCIGADIFFDNSSYIYYRQHSDNAAGYIKPHRRWKDAAKEIFPRLVKSRDHTIQRQIREVSEFYQKELDEQVKRKVGFIADYNKNIKSKWKLLTDPDISERPVLDRAIWAYKVLFNMI